MTTWPPRRPWQHFDTADLVEALATLERRPVDTFVAIAIAALRAELALRDPTNGPARETSRGLGNPPCHSRRGGQVYDEAHK